MMAIEGWDYKNIDDLAVLDQESLGAGTKRSFSFYYIDISSVSEGKLRLPSTKIIFRDAPSRARKIVRRGDVLISTVRPNLKAFAYFDHTDDDCIASTGFAVLTARDQVDARFILYSILSDGVTAQIEALVVGSNYPAINSNAVRGLQVLVPPYSEQNKIAEILSTVDQAIEQTEALIAKQQRIKTGLMQDLLTRGIDEHGNLRSEQTHEFKDSPLGMIPVEWEVKTLGDALTDITYGLTVRPKYVADGVPLVSGKECRDGWIDYASCNRITEREFGKLRERSIPKPGHILITKTGTLGRVAPIKAADPISAITQNVALLKPDQDVVLSDYLELVLNSDKIQRDIKDGVTVLSIPDLQLGVLSGFLIPIPSLDEQQVISRQIAKHVSVLGSEQRYLNKLRSLKTALMQDLLTGKKRVTTLLKQEVSSV